MSERYWITGAQIGEIIGLIRARKLVQANHVLKDIAEKQFIGNMPMPYEHYDIAIFKKLMKKEGEENGTETQSPNNPNTP